MQKLDLVIQGQIFDYTQKIVDSYKTLEWVNDVIVSTWEDDPPILADKVVRSLPITNLGIGNRNAQIVTSHRGLQEVKTDFCAKLRSDQTISLDSMNKMYGFSLKNQEKICVAGFYRPFPFHPRDHIFWGQTAEVAEVFEVPLSFLMNPTHHMLQTLEWEGRHRQWFAMPYHDGTVERYIWGATAGMLRNLYRCLSA